MRIPLSAVSEALPAAGTRWRLNLFRLDRANHAGLAWSPPLSGTFHVPERLARWNSSNRLPHRKGLELSWPFRYVLLP